jgi:hypothetical protein
MTLVLTLLRLPALLLSLSLFEGGCTPGAGDLAPTPNAGDPTMPSKDRCQRARDAALTADHGANTEVQLIDEGIELPGWCFFTVRVTAGGEVKEYRRPSREDGLDLRSLDYPKRLEELGRLFRSLDLLRKPDARPVAQLASVVALVYAGAGTVLDNPAPVVERIEAGLRLTFAYQPKPMGSSESKRIFPAAVSYETLIRPDYVVTVDLK